MIPTIEIIPGDGGDEFARTPWLPWAGRRFAGSAQRHSPAAVRDDGDVGVSVEAGAFPPVIGGLNPSTLPNAEFQIVASCTQVTHPGQVGMSFPIRTRLKPVR